MRNVENAAHPSACGLKSFSLDVYKCKTPELARTFKSRHEGRITNERLCPTRFAAQTYFNSIDSSSWRGREQETRTTRQKAERFTGL